MTKARRLRLSDDYAFRTLGDASVAIFDRETGDTHFLHGVAAAGDWIRGELLDTATLVSLLESTSNTAATDLENLLRLGILVDGD